jgi:hypothetical protein
MRRAAFTCAWGPSWGIQTVAKARMVGRPGYADYQKRTDREIPVFVLE